MAGSATIKWFDSHAHLQDEAFMPDLAEVLERAFASQISNILLPSSSFPDAKKALDLAGQDARLVCAIGCHPHEARHYHLQTVAQWQQLLQADQAGKIVAVGEIVLDNHYEHSPRQIQQDVF